MKTSNQIKISLITLVVSIGFAASMAQAGEAPKAKSYKKRSYGMAGCGVGSMVIKEDTQSGQLVSWLLNGVAGYFISFANPSYAITSGTSNCENPSSQMAMEQEVFFRVNLADITREAAAGQGVHLEALADLLGCSDAKTFSRYSQEQFGTLFQDSEPSAVMNRYLEGLRQEKAPVQCDRVS